MEIGWKVKCSLSPNTSGLMSDTCPNQATLSRVGCLFSDQRRVYKYIIGQLIQTGARPLRLMVQASAGTGKSFLLTSVYLFCILNKLSCKAAAPTGHMDTEREAALPATWTLGWLGKRPRPWL